MKLVLLVSPGLLSARLLRYQANMTKRKRQSDAVESSVAAGDDSVLLDDAAELQPDTLGADGMPKVRKRSNGSQTSLLRCFSSDACTASARTPIPSPTTISNSASEAKVEQQHARS